MLSPAENTALTENGAKIPLGWQVLEPGTAKTTILTVGQDKVGVVFFPEAAKPGSEPGEKEFKAIDKAVKELRPQVKLVIGVSPWGVQTESDYLQKQKPDVDILLGSGIGPGFSAKVADKDKTLWMHTYSKGKALYTIDVLAWPGAKGFKWVPDKSFTSKTVILDESFPADPAMQEMLKDVQDPGDKTAK